MSSYKLIYFDLTGRAEPIRYIFAYCNQPYEDVRVSREQWHEIKKDTPFGQIPILEIDGKPVAQSNAIARYLARQFKLTGKDEWEALQCDVLIDTISDFQQGSRKLFLESDPEKKEALKKKIYEEEYPFYLSRFNSIVDKNGGFAVGSQTTWADFVFATTLSSIEKRNAGVLKPYPALTNLIERVHNLPAIKKWLEIRPVEKPMMPPPGHGKK
ncbi:glutathione S-transferase S1-like [Rhynchophorus ferrugineus]|uniref:glutathione transferase n=1 Tax=Rhynchophorus ferrugineus TaxID=354439 RepID=A0A834IXW1_RHYFE|nr:hypothetical protein GWI33_006015 [Rhynchophorus ferrugineus]